MKYSQAGGVIALRAGAEGDQVRISVSDQGIGIRENDLPAHFRAFLSGRQGEEPRARRNGIGPLDRQAHRAAPWRNGPGPERAREGERRSAFSCLSCRALSHKRYTKEIAARLTLPRMFGPHGKCRCRFSQSYPGAQLVPTGASGGRANHQGVLWRQRAGRGHRARVDHHFSLSRGFRILRPEPWPTCVSIARPVSNTSISFGPFRTSMKRSRAT